MTIENFILSTFTLVHFSIKSTLLFFSKAWGVSFAFLFRSLRRMDETSLLQRVKSPQYNEPLILYQKKLSCQKWKCKHEQVCQAVLIFRSRWAELNKSLETFRTSDFQVIKLLFILLKKKFWKYNVIPVCFQVMLLIATF